MVDIILNFYELKTDNLHNAYTEMRTRTAKNQKMSILRITFFSLHNVLSFKLPNINMQIANLIIGCKTQSKLISLHLQFNFNCKCVFYSSAIITLILDRAKTACSHFCLRTTTQSCCKCASWKLADGRKIAIWFVLDSNTFRNHYFVVDCITT